MLNRRPLTWGLILGASSHLIEWIPVILAALNQWDVGFFIGIAVVLARAISFFCLNLNAVTESDTWRRGSLFALSWLATSIVLLSIEFILFSDGHVFSWLDPHSSFLTGLAYILFAVIEAMEIAIEVLIAGIQTLLRARRDHKRAPASSPDTFINENERGLS